MLVDPLEAAGAGGDPTGYYSESPMFQSRPDPTRERYFGGIGTTGLKPRIYPGVVLKVEKMAPGSPSDGKIAKGEIINGINGTDLKGLNPFVAIGNALTKAEATDGKMVFDVTSAEGKTQLKETVTIPVLGSYSKTWPLDCPKSKRIIDEAAAFYSNPEKFNQGGILGALACLFLLSTGDDQYLPRVKVYFDAFPKDVKAIGDHTWNNGYNGIACGEYIVMRTTFEIDALNFDSYRVSILCPQGFRIYLNGQEIAAYGWWQDKPHYAPWSTVSPERLKTGINTIAVYSNVAYDDSTKAPYGQVDCLIEGLKL
jgi:hypothetical protein